MRVSAFAAVAAVVVLACLSVEAAGPQYDEYVPGSARYRMREGHKSQLAKAKKHKCHEGQMKNKRNGKIMTHATMTTIFWGPTWLSHKDDVVAGVDKFMRGYGDSSYAKTMDEYMGSNGRVGPRTTYRGHIVNKSPPPTGDPSNAVVFNMICSQISAPPPPDSLYAVISARGAPASANYCGYHDHGICKGVLVRWLFMWNMTATFGCGQPDFEDLGHSRGLVFTADTLAHEISEARTDPDGDAWQDGCGGECGDKCAGTYPQPFVTFSDGTRWRLQGEWSNAAYAAGTGTPNYRGQRACVSK